MATRKKSSADPYREVKKMFEKLDLPQKGAFVIEAFFTALAEAFEEAGEAIARAIEEEFEASREAPPRKKTQAQGPPNGTSK